MRKVQYKGLGFPVWILDPKFNEDGTMKLDLNRLMEDIFAALLAKPARFSGSEVRFIRTYMDLTQVDFAKLLKLKDHSSVSKWEKKLLEATNMDPNTELALRLAMAENGHFDLAEAYRKALKAIEKKGVGQRLSLPAAAA